jgi:hypothetical protein
MCYSFELYRLASHRPRWLLKSVSLPLYLSQTDTTWHACTHRPYTSSYTSCRHGSITGSSQVHSIALALLEPCKRTHAHTHNSHLTRRAKKSPNRRLKNDITLCTHTHRHMHTHTHMDRMTLSSSICRSASSLGVSWAAGTWRLFVNVRLLGLYASYQVLGPP